MDPDQVTIDNIEDKVQNIILDKLKNGQSLKDLNENDLASIKKLFELFPDLKEKFSKQVESVKPDEIKIAEKEIVFDEIIISGITYYKDARGGLWDTKTDLVGVLESNNPPKYVFFDHKIKL